jgi:hypothetical protein
MTIELKSTNGYTAIIDDSYSDLQELRWTATPKGYFFTKKNRKTIYLHRIINRTPVGMDTDHINRDTSDCRRSNLRTASRSLNQFNRPQQKNNTTGYKGVTKTPTGYKATIQYNLKKIHLGCYLTLPHAYQAYRIAQDAYHRA